MINYSKVVLGEVSVLSQILNIKLASFIVLARKERKEDTQYVPESTEIY
jgi:hypothetical protein